MEVKEKKPGRDGCRGIGAEKPVVAVDVDEVLGKFLVPMCHFHNARYGTSLSPLDFHSYRFSDVWGGTDDEAARKVHEFFETHFFREEFEPIEGAEIVLKRLSEYFEFVVVTSRPTCIEAETRSWLDRNYKGIFSEVLFGNHFGLKGGKRSKTDLCMSMKAICLIDDSYKYASECAPALRQVLLFGDYPWNQVGQGLPIRAAEGSSVSHTSPTQCLAENIVRVLDWDDVFIALSELQDAT